jgi:hypothetical protein
MNRHWVVAASLLAALSACATSRVAPVSIAKDAAVRPSQSPGEAPAKRICIVENPRVVQKDFLDAYRAALEGKGFTVSVVQKNPQASVCPLTTRYVAYWKWDLLYYLSFAQLDVYSEGKEVGQAIHNARGSRFITTEGTVKELVDRLFP